MEGAPPQNMQLGFFQDARKNSSLGSMAPSVVRVRPVTWLSELNRQSTINDVFPAYTSNDVRFKHLFHDVRAFRPRDADMR